MKKYLSGLLLLTIVFLATAQAPQQVNYQAVVRDAAGNPLPAGTHVSVEFQIHDQTPSGSVVYQETTTAITNQFGLITYGLGSSGNLSVVNWGNGPKYLQVLIDPTGGTSFSNMGTTQLLSVPYALYAGNSGGNSGATGPTGPGGNTGPQGPQGMPGPAGTTGGQGVTGPQGPQGNQGLQGATGATGTNGTNGATGVTGATGTNGTNGSNGVTGATGATGATGTTGTNGLNGVTGATGATGITGTNGTNGATGVTGATGTNGANGSNGVTGATGVNGNNGATGSTGATGETGQNGTNGLNGVTGATGLQGPTGAGGLSGTLNYVVKFTPDGFTGGNSVIYDNGSAVGIGTSSPVDPLTVNGSGGIWNSNKINFYADNGASQKGFIGNYSSGSDFAIASTSSSNWMRIGANNGSIAFFPDGTLASGNSPKVIFNVNGSAGFGTGNPASFFDIRQDSVGNMGPNLSISNYAAGQGYGGTIDFLTYPLFPSQGPSARIAVADDGDFSGSILFMTEATHSNGYNLTERMRVADNGNVGIGTSSPGSLLTVNGNTQTLMLYVSDSSVTSLFQMTTGASNGYIMQSDGHGNASWVNPSTLVTPNIYNSNGSLTGSRTVGMGSDDLIFNSTTGNFVFNPSSGGKMGVGTSSPGNTLTINGSGGIWNSNALNFYTDAGITQRGFVGNYASASDFSIASTGSGNWMRIGANSGNIAFFPDNTITSGTTPKVIINSSGSVGIGTTAPANALSVNAGMNIDQAAANNGSLANNTSTGNGLTFGSAAGEGIASNRANSTAGSNQYGLDLYTDFTKRMSITNGGSVGIGTAAPASLFTVSGGESTANGKNAAIQISNTASGGANWYLRAGATGTNTPAGGLSIANDGAYVMDIDNTGNIGIGTSTPSTLLHVNGKLTISDGTQGNGKILMSDANGKASWTSNTKALNPSFKVQGNAGQSVGYNEEIQLNFTGISWDDAGTMSLNNGYTVPLSGNYHFDVRVTWNEFFNENSAITYIECYVNGNAVDIQYTNITVNLSYGNPTSTYSGLVQLNEGDVVTFKIYQENTSGEGQDIDDYSSSETSWSGYKVN